MELVILIGLQGAGKSTFRRHHLDATHAVVSKDLFRNNRRPARRQAQLIEESLAGGASVVVDNTNPTREERAALIAQARVHGAAVTGYFFPAPLPTALERNARRGGKARVPDVAVYATAKRLEPPSRSEGFDRLFTVESFAIESGPGGGPDGVRFAIRDCVGGEP